MIRYYLQDFELREYEATRWVSTAQLGIDYDAAVEKMFMRLFNYISGENQQSKCLCMDLVFD